jgi:hypothetical protein
MLRLLTATGTLLSVFALIRQGSKTRSLTTQDKFVRWSVAVRVHNQFGSWT